jgi:hypothetical protein
MSDNDFTVRNRLNRVDPNVLGQLLQRCRLGEVLGRLAADAAIEETLAVAGNGVLPSSLVDGIADRLCDGPHCAVESQTT